MKQIVINYPGVGEWTAHRAGGEFSGIGATIGVIENGVIQAGILYDNYNGANIHISVAAVPGRSWVTKKLLHVVFDYPFRQLKVNRITSFVADTNEASIRFTEHIGFTREATLADAHPTGNLIIYVMRRENCRWLNLEV